MLCLADPSVKAKSQVYLCARSLKCSTARLHSQNRKFMAILIISKAKNAYFFVCKRTRLVHQRLKDFVNTKSLLIATIGVLFCPKRYKQPSPSNVFLNGVRVQFFDQVKYLGVWTLACGGGRPLRRGHPLRP